MFFALRMWFRDVYLLSAILFILATKGRPMKFVEPAFRDIVSGKMVNIYRDLLNGEEWLATNRWGIGGRVLAAPRKK